MAKADMFASLDSIKKSYKNLGLPDPHISEDLDDPDEPPTITVSWLRYSIVLAISENGRVTAMDLAKPPSYRQDDDGWWTGLLADRLRRHPPNGRGVNDMKDAPRFDADA